MGKVEERIDGLLERGGRGGNGEDKRGNNIASRGDVEAAGMTSSKLLHAHRYRIWNSGVVTISILPVAMDGGSPPRCGLAIQEITYNRIPGGILSGALVQTGIID